MPNIFLLTILSLFITSGFGIYNEKYQNYFMNTNVNLKPDSEVFLLNNDCNLLSCHIDLDVLLKDSRIDNDNIVCISTYMNCYQRDQKEQLTKINMNLNETIKNITLGDNIFLKK